VSPIYASPLAQVYHISNLNVRHPAYVMPTTVETMNYNSVIIVGVVALTGIWWLLHAVRHYRGPRVMHLYLHDDQVVATRVPTVESKME
jgi:choline transport protein